MLKKVLLKGPILSHSGYGVHCRQVFKALSRRKDIDLYIQAVSWGTTSWLLNDKNLNEEIKEILHCAAKDKRNINFDETFQVCLPNEWEIIGNKNIGITAGFEASFVKKSWIEKCNEMSYVIVPSEFTKNAFIKTSKDFNLNIRTKIYVINEAYPEYFSQNKETSNSLSDQLAYDKNILIMGQISSFDDLADRKNTFKTIKSAIDFVEDKNIGIVLKINAGNYSEFFKEKILQVIKDRFNKYERRKLNIIFQCLDLENLRNLYECNKISCFYSGTRGEGWGLSFLESAYFGIPIIATDYSAYKEYLGNNFVKIPFDHVPVGVENNLFIDNKLKKPTWAEFSYDEAIKSLNSFFNNEEENINKAARLQKIIKQNYNFDTINKKYCSFFEKI